MNNKIAPGLQDFSKQIKPHVKKYSGVGIKGFTRVVASTVRVLGIFDLRVFDTKQEALDYLVS
ncbi:MAG: hypothetical protein RIM99_04935 [Cyclobacteriaceae bacterium]